MSSGGWLACSDLPDDRHVMSSAPIDRARTLHQLGDLTPDEIAAAPDAIDGTGITGGPDPAAGHRFARHRSESSGSVPLVEALTQRRSRRTTPATELPGDLLGWLLEQATGQRDDGRRPHPSAGAAYPLQTHVVANRCTGIEPGIHRYDPHAHGLALHRAGDPGPMLHETFGRGWIGDARAVLLLTAHLGVATAIHGPRGYRYALLEAGHLAQNLLLLATAADLPACPVAGFADAWLARELGVTGDEVPTYAVVL